MRIPAFCLALLAALLPLPVVAGEADIIDASAQRVGDQWRISATIRHADTGWDHYADGWSVNTPDGTELGYRTLAHPHENEQPFTRSLGGITVPDGVSEVVIRAHDSVHGWSDETYTLQLQ